MGLLVAISDEDLNLLLSALKVSFLLRHNKNIRVTIASTVGGEPKLVSQS